MAPASRPSTISPGVRSDAWTPGLPGFAGRLLRPPSAGQSQLEGEVMKLDLRRRVDKETADCACPLPSASRRRHHCVPRIRPVAPGGVNLDPRIFVVGMPKCGTTSLHQFFLDSGIPSIHWGDGRLAMRMAHNVLTGNPILAGYEEYRAFVNMDSSCGYAIVRIADLYLDVLLAEHPDGKFILNVRDNWFAPICSITR